jgi:hypothetical protein
MYYNNDKIIYLDKGIATTNIKSNDYVNNKLRENTNTNTNNTIDTNTKYKYTYNNKESDILLNPYAPPIAKNHYNIPLEENAANDNSTTCKTCMTFGKNLNNGYVKDIFTQVGIIVGQYDTTKILPLMGRLLYKNRDKWQYYVINNDNNAVKLSLIINNHRCTNEYGCNEIFNNDIVKIDGGDDEYKVTIYDINDTIYSPSLD